MKFSFEGNAVYKLGNKQEYWENVSTDIIEDEVDIDTIKYAILYNICESFDANPHIKNTVLQDGETFTIGIDRAYGINFVCTAEDFTYVHRNIYGFSEKFSRDFEKFLDEILCAYTETELISKLIYMEGFNVTDTSEDDVEYVDGRFY